MKLIKLTDGEIEVADLEELRHAYRELLEENQNLRALISAKTCAAIEDLRGRERKFNGNLPYGLEADDDKKLMASRYETRLIAQIKKLHASGLSLRAIARTLTEKHFVNRDGNSIDAKQVARILDAAGIARTHRAPSSKPEKSS